MRLSNTQAVSRPTYYDRNSIDKVLSFTSTTGPHATTTRLTYTVPVGRKAFIELIFLYIRRTAGATTPGLYQSYMDDLPGAGGGGTIANNVRIDNTVDSGTPMQLTNYGALIAGDTLNINTNDGSVGGTVQYTLSLKGMEFDA